MRPDRNPYLRRYEELASAAKHDTEAQRPEGDSVLLIELPRGPRHDPSAEVVRWSLDTFTPQDQRRENTKPVRYVSARVWFKGQDGTYHPTKRGITTRASELVNVVKALVGAARTLGLLPAKGGQDHG